VLSADVVQAGGTELDGRCVIGRLSAFRSGKLGMLDADVIVALSVVASESDAVEGAPCLRVPKYSGRKYASSGCEALASS
jgi:hypothetical protein